MSEILSRSRRANLDAWRIHTIANGGEIIENDALFTCFTGAPHAMWNPTVALADGFADALPAIEKEYEARGVSFGFLADERFAAEAADAAARFGLHPNRPSPIMVLHPAGDLETPAHDVRRVADFPSLEDHVATQAAGFGNAIDELRMFIRPSVLASTERLYTVYSDGMPVATSVMVATGAEAGIFGVSTHPAHRRRGLGRAATVAALRDAVAAGCDLVYLSASDLGYTVYEALGFATVEHHRSFVREPGEPGP